MPGIYFRGFLDDIQTHTHDTIETGVSRRSFGDVVQRFKTTGPLVALLLEPFNETEYCVGEEGNANT